MKIQRDQVLVRVHDFADFAMMCRIQGVEHQPPSVAFADGFYVVVHDRDQRHIAQGIARTLQVQRERSEMSPAVKAEFDRKTRRSYDIPKTVEQLTEWLDQITGE